MNDEDAKAAVLETIQHLKTVNTLDDLFAILRRVGELVEAVAKNDGWLP